MLRACERALVLAGSGLPPVWPTTARLTTTEEHVHARFDCRANAVVATMTSYKDKVWMEDAVEMFVWPDGDPYLYEFQLSPAGVCRDLRVADHGGAGQAFDGDWRCHGLDTRASLRKDEEGRLVGWTGDIIVPWAGLGRSGPPGSWRVGLFRIHRTDPEEFSALRARPGEPIDFHHNAMLERVGAA